MDRIICVAGPTASGKTKLAVQLAKRYGGEVVSCDSMQIYKHMDIGTAKPTEEEMEGVAHHLIDLIEPGEDFSAGKYVQLADKCVQDILSRGKTAVIAGGTGLYVDSLIAGRSFAPVPQTGRREALEAQLREEGGEAMLARLRSIDPEAAARLQVAIDDARSRLRVTRLEVKPLEAGGAELHFSFVNESEQTIHYVYYGVTFYDAGGTVISLESTGAEICERVASGPFAHGGGAEETETLWGGDGREPVSVHLTALSIEYEDGSIYTFTDDQLAAVLEP